MYVVKVNVQKHTGNVTYKKTVEKLVNQQPQQNYQHVTNMVDKIKVDQNPGPMLCESS
jgi:hypothetical protein